MYIAGVLQSTLDSFVFCCIRKAQRQKHIRLMMNCTTHCTKTFVEEKRAPLFRIMSTDYSVEYILIIFQRDATQSSLFVILHVHSTCFWCQPHPSSGVHKTVTAASGTATSLQCGQSLTALDGGSCTKNTTSTGGCSYSFVYS